MIVQEQARKFMPCIAFIAQDSAEADELGLHYSTWNCARSCRICDLPRESRHLTQLGNPRTTNETRARSSAQGEGACVGLVVVIRLECGCGRRLGPGSLELGEILGGP